MSVITDLQIKHQISKDLEKVEAYLLEVLNTDSEDFNQLIRPLSAGGGKRLRAQLVLMIAREGDSKEMDRVKVAAAVEMLHLATLIHDDVLDQAEVRRGVPAIHCSKGNKVAILSGDYLFAKAFEVVADIESVPCLKVFSFVIKALVEGEFMQMEDVYRLNQGTERYLIKTQKKTADFIEACMELGGILGHLPENTIKELKAYGHALGMAFQVTDDIIDYRETEETAGKPVGNDIKEGILTYPLLSVVNEQTEPILAEKIEAVRRGDLDVQDVIDYVVAEGGVSNTLALESKYTTDAKMALAHLKNLKCSGILKKVIESMADRKV